MSMDFLYFYMCVSDKGRSVVAFYGHYMKIPYMR